MEDESVEGIDQHISAKNYSLLMGRTLGVWQGRQGDTECASGEDSDEYEPQASTSVQGLSTRRIMRRTRGNSESNLTSHMRT